MQISNLIINASPKTSWQCFDLGCRVALADFKTLFGYWITLTFPIFILCIVVNLQWGLFIFWLCKPWYERGLLYILSRTVFGIKVSIKDALFALPSQIKPLWFSSITFRRLAPSRSFDMAVAQLENLRSARRSIRLSILHKSKDDNTAWWTVCCVHWETFLMLALVTLIQILLPGEVDFYLMIESLSISNSLENYMFAFCFYVSSAIVAPFYIAGGFVAYLNRRVILEGWDIELGFNKWLRSFSERQTRSGSNIQHKSNSEYPTSKPRLSIALILLLNASLFCNEISYAQGIQAENTHNKKQVTVASVTEEKTEPFQVEKQKIKDDLYKVLDKPPFAQREIVTQYRWKASTEDEKTETDLEFLSFFTRLIGNFFAIILWVTFLSFFAYLIYRNRENIKTYLNKEGHQKEAETLPSFISNTFKEELPANILPSVEEAINSQNYRRALSILLRACFITLGKEQNIHISKSMTENECLNEIEQSCSQQIHIYMQTLLGHWMKMAWAHQLPDKESLQNLKQGYEKNFIQQANDSHAFNVNHDKPHDHQKGNVE